VPGTDVESQSSNESPAGIADRILRFQRPALVISLLLAVATLALYSRVAQWSFVNYDDNHYIAENPYVLAGITWTTIKWAFTTHYCANWHPLTWLSHALDCDLFGLHPAGHHLTSLLFHAINVVLLFLLLFRSTRRAGASFLVAALFAVHPLNVESVAWIAERKNVLSTMFFLLTLGAYGWYALKPGWKRYCAVAGLLACGLASKPMVVTAPFVLLLLDYWPLGRIRGWSSPTKALAIQQSSAGKLLLEKLPLLLLVAASSVITVVAQRASGAVGAAPFPLGARLKNAIYAYAVYLWKTIWPSHLTVFYPYMGRSVALWRVGAAALLLVAITAAVLRLHRSQGYLLTGWLWFLGTLVPVIGIIQVGNQAMADRYAYVPLIGIFVMIAFVAAEWADQKKWGPAVQLGPAIGLLLALSVVTYRQIQYWRDDVTLWSHALEVTQHNFVAEESMGVALAQRNRPDEAYSLFVRAAEDEPNDPVARLNIGTYLDQHGRTAEAVAQYELTLRLGTEPGLLAATYANLGSAYTELGNDSAALASFEKAVRLNPYLPGAWEGLSSQLQKQGNLDDAIGCMARSIQLQPSSQGYLRLAQVLAEANHPKEARAAYERAQRIAAGNARQ